MILLVIFIYWDYYLVICDDSCFEYNLKVVIIFVVSGFVLWKLNENRFIFLISV